MIVFEPNTVKLHDNLTRGLNGDVVKQKYVERFVKMAESLDIELIAEGIEAQGDMQCLLDLNVRMGQGFYWGYPKKPSEFAPSAAAKG